jgi:hypothetical protein
MELLQKRQGQSMQEFTIEFRKREIHMGVSLKSLDMLVKYLGALFPHIRRKLMLFIPNTIDEASIQAQYKRETSEETNKSSQASRTTRETEKKKNKKKWNEKKIVETTQEETPSIQQCKGCDRKGHTEENCWKLHPEKCPKYFQKKKKKALISVDVEEWVDNTSDLEGNINCTNIHKEVALVSCSHKEEKVMTELFCIKIHMKQSKVDCLFDPGSQSNLISTQLVEKLGLETQDHPHPYPLGWVRKYVELKVRKQCKFKFSINQNFVDEVVANVVPLDICGVILGSPYLYVRDAIFRRRENQYRLVKDGKYAINAQKDKAKLSLISAHQERRIMGSTKKFVLLF